MRISRFLFAASFFALTALSACGGQTAAAEISGAEARQLVQQGAQLVDVRTPEEYASGHIEGAVNIPLQELESRLGELAGKDEDIVVYCRSGRRSAQAASILANAGYAKVHQLGAMSRW